MKSFKQFVKIIKPYLIGSIIITAIYFFYLFLGGMWPFGKNTLAHYDCYFQVAQMFGFTFDIIDGTSTICFSNLIGGGANIVGVWLYFFLNPFIFIPLIFGRANIYFAINLMYLLYFLTIFNVFLYFLHKKFNNLSIFNKILLATVYTFSAYVLCNYTIMVWLNFMILLPLLALEFEKVILKNKIWGFSIITALIIYTSYAVGSSLQIILIVVYFLYIFTNVQKENRKSACFNVLIGLFCGLLLSLIVLIPSMLQLQTSCRINQNIEASINDYALGTNILFYFIAPTMLLITIWYLIKSFKKDGFSKFLAYALIICSLPLLFDFITCAVAGGIYICFSARFYSINSFLLILTLCKAFSSNINSANLPINNKKIGFSYYCIIILLAFLLLLSIFSIPISLRNNLSIGQLTIENILGFLPIPLCILSIITITLLFFKKANNKQRVSRVLFTTLLIIESIIGGICCISTGSYNTDDAIAYYNLTSDLSPYARVQTNSNHIGANGNLLSGVSSYSIFSSTAENSSYELTSFIGTNTQLPNITSTGSTLFADLLLGNEYFVSTIDLSDRNYLSLEKQYNNYYLYKYKYTFPRAFVVDEIKDFDYSTTNVLENQNKIAKMLGASSNIINKNDNGLLTQIEHKDINNEIYNAYKITFTAEYSGIAYFSHKLKYTVSHFIDAENHMLLAEKNQYSVLQVEKGNEYSFVIYQNKNKDAITEEDYNINILDTWNLENLCIQLNTQKVDVQYNKNGYTLDCNNLSNRNILVLQSNPKGMQYSSNGANEFNVKTKLFDFTYFENVDNEQITAQFIYPYTSTTLIVGISAIIIAIIILIIVQIKRKWFVKFENIAKIGFVILIFAILIYFYAIPSVKFIYTLFRLL